MNKYTKMMLMNSGKDRDRREYDRNRDMPEDKFRDSRGREHYDNGRYAPRSEHESYIEDRYDDRGRRHYESGRYAPTRSEYGGYREDRYPMYPSTVPPMYRDNGGMDYRPMNKIGFAMEGEMERRPEWDHNYRSEAEYQHMDEMGYHPGENKERGHYAMRNRMGDKKMDKQMAERWLMNMENADSTTGPHWTMEQAKQVMAQRGIECDPVEFWVALNAMFSDYAKVAKELNVSNIDFYAKMAEAFLEDSDAMPGKLSRYYEYVVKH